MGIVVNIFAGIGMLFTLWVSFVIGWYLVGRWKLRREKLRYYEGWKL